MKKKRVKRLILLLTVIMVLGIIGYYTVEVLSAREKTPKIVANYYQTGMIKIDANDLTPVQKDMLLKIQDPNFYGHHGVDFVTPGAGWTTITQSLAKQFYFVKFEQGLMKIKQTLCAWLALDPLVDKDTQLTLFINMMYFGNGVYGLRDAADHYFGKAVPELDDDEFIALIACLIDPEGLNITDYPQENAQRVKRIKKMLSGEYVPHGLFDITYDKADE